MTVFWVVAVFLIIAALLFVLPPLLQRGSAQREVGRNALNIEIAKDKLAELERDLANGIIGQDQYERAKQELERSLLEDVSGAAGGAAPATQPGAVTAAVVGIAVPLVAFVLYQQLGGGLAAFQPELAQQQVNAEGHQGTIQAMVGQLESRLQSNPDDGEGWMMLGRSYYFLKRYSDAAKAYGRAAALGGDQDPGLLADYADTVAMANGRSMQGQPYELVKKALGIEPFHEKSLWLAGTAAYQLEDYAAALDYWERLKQVFPPGSQNFEQMQQNILEVQQLMAQRGMKVPASSASTAVAAARPAAAAAAANGAAKITGSVKLVPALAANAAPTDTVFVFARAAQGPRMPLAIVRKQVKDLPFSFTLDDSMAMNPSMKLSSFPQVVVGARISKSGNAMPQSGDLQGQSEVVAVGAGQAVDVVINSVTP
jgi:cytochrome c-type biogenesis protein CcmH